MPQPRSTSPDDWLGELHRELSEALWTTDARQFPNNASMGLGNIPDGLYAIARGLHAIADALERGREEPEAEPVRKREVTIVDKRRAA